MRPLGFGTTALAAMLLSALPAEGQVITGRISDAHNGRAIAAVRVSLSGSSLGALSEGNGKYRIQNVPAGTHTASVQRLGYRPASQVVEVAQGQAVELDFELESQGLSLDAVVVTGTAGGSRARAVGHLVERVDVPDLLSEAAVSTVEDVLTGRIPGVMMIGSPNSAGDGAQIRIRGSASMSLLGDPIFYVDGVRMISDRGFVQRYSATSRLNDIDLRDIESIEVIKGPAAATLYGTEASNGVIQIVTKRGEVGAPVFDFTAETGTMWLPERYITNGWIPDPALCPSIPCASVDQLVKVNLIEINKERGFSDVFTHGLTQRYNASVRGGTELLRYSASLSRSDQDGVVDWNWDERSSVRASIQVNATETFSFTLNGAYSESERGPPQNFWGANFAWGGQPNTIFNDHPNRGFRTPPEALDPSVHSEIFTTKRTTWSLELNHEATNWLSYRLVAGIDEIDERFDGLDISGTFFVPDAREEEMEVRKRQLPVATLDFSGTASFRFGDGSLGSASSYGVQYYHRRDLSSQVTSETLTASAPSTVGATITTADRLLWENTTLGAYIQQEFDWENRIFLTGAIRRDDNSAFGAKFDNAFYPKVMTTWVVHEEDFWNIDWVSQLRLRGAWGASGQQPDVFAASRLSTRGTDTNRRPILTPSSIGNPDLGPERSEELELGFDAELWDGKVSANFTWFSRSTKDAILARIDASSVGMGGVRPVNIGEVKAWGAETSLRVRALDREPVQWDMAIAFTTLGNRIVEMGETERVPIGRSRAHYQGFPIAAVAERRILSAEFVNGVNGQITNILCDGGTGRKGLELGGAPVPCDNAPLLVWGPSEPSWLVNLTSTWTLFDDWRLTANIDAQGGHWMSSDYLAARHTNFHTSRLTHLQDNAVGQAYRQETRNGLAYHRAGFAKLRELTLAYTLPDAVTDRIGATRANVTLGVRNLARLWLAQKFVERERITDPEMSRPDNQFAGESGGDWPPLSFWSLRMNITF